jgi:ketosteroid isomerase-like protein
MSIEQNKAVLRHWLEGWNRGDVDQQVALADEVYTTDFCGHGHGPTLEDVKQHVRKYHNPGVGTLTIEDMIGEGDKVAARFTYRWTDKSTGKPMVERWMSIARFSAGKIAEEWALVKPPESHT